MTAGGGRLHVAWTTSVRSEGQKCDVLSNTTLVMMCGFLFFFKKKKLFASSILIFLLIPEFHLVLPFEQVSSNWSLALLVQMPNKYVLP